MKFHEDAFEAATVITAAIAEEAELKLNKESAEKASRFFSILYKNLTKVAQGEFDEDECEDDDEEDEDESEEDEDEDENETSEEKCEKSAEE